MARTPPEDAFEAFAALQSRTWPRRRLLEEWVSKQRLAQRTALKVLSDCSDRMRWAREQIALEKP